MLFFLVKRNGKRKPIIKTTRSLFTGPLMALFRLGDINPSLPGVSRFGSVPGSPGHFPPKGSHKLVRVKLHAFIADASRLKNLSRARFDLTASENGVFETFEGRRVERQGALTISSRLSPRKMRR